MAPTAPRGLEAEGRRFWRSVTAEFELDVKEAVLLDTACRLIDDLARLQKALGGEPTIVKGSTGQARAHPLLAEMRAHRLALEKVLSALKLPAEPAAQLDTSSAARKAARARWSRKGLGSVGA